MGWARQPVHRCVLPGTWGRRKRWDYWCVTTPTHILSVTYADVDYLGLVRGFLRAPRETARAARDARRALRSLAEASLAMPTRRRGGLAGTPSNSGISEL